MADIKSSQNNLYSVSGTVRNQYQQPYTGIKVSAFDKDIRSEQLLGEAQTNDQGFYQIFYTQASFAITDKQFADVLLRLYDANGTLLKQTDVVYNAPAQLTVDVAFSTQTYKGPSEFELVLAAVTPYTGELPIASVTESADTQDITFLTNKTGLQQNKIEALAMAYLFESQTKITAVVFYGLLREGVPANPTQKLLQSIAAPTYEQLAQQKLNGIMQENIDVLMQALQQAVNDNIIPLSISADFERIKAELISIISQWAQQHPQTGTASPLFQNIRIAGLSDEDARQVTAMIAQHQGSIQSFFSALTSHETLSGSADQLNAIFQLSSLTNNNVQLTNNLVKNQQINKADDIRKLAANTKADWENLLTQQNIDVPAGGKDTTLFDRIKGFAEKLEKNFTKKFPTTAFASRLKQDDTAASTQQNKLVNFLDAHPDFDLQNHRIESFLSTNANDLSGDEKTTIASQLRRIQRVFKLAPTYDASKELLDNGIHSSAQIYAMGKDRFTQTFAPQLGAKETNQIFANAAKMYAQTIAVAGNMHALATASKLNALPDYQQIMKLSSAAVEIPNLDVLFEHTDFCDCDECRSVYGAASYLTDALHFLSQRMTTGADTVRDKLLQRRPDIGDIDLNCDNTNTQLPYIDIVNEILEETISPTVLSIALTFTTNLPAFVPLISTDPLPDRQYAIDNALLSELITHTADLPHIDVLLTSNAMVSDAYQAMGSTSTQWIIRDKALVLKLTQNAEDITVQLLHQSLLSTDELSANPEYTNVKVYDNFLATAKRPFGLPFDLFSTEGEIYLTKLGAAKADLIRIFAQENLPASTPPTNQLEEAYAYLEVSFAERDLIFKEDLINQTDYWGALASSSTVEVDFFLNYTGLEYADLMTLLVLPFINPLLDSKIDHQDLTCDLYTQFITNVSAEKFDHLHRFLRLWKKTTFTLEELDACIQCTAIGGGKIDENFAWQLHTFLQLKNRFGLDVYPLLAMYEDIQSTGDDNLYNSLFQNKQITFPLNPDFALTNVNNGITITDIHRSVIEAATFITPDDLNVLLTDNSITTLSLAHLSLIYRNNLLLQSLSLSANDLDLAKQVVPSNVFNSPVDTMDFLAKFDTLTNVGIGVWDLNYILRQQNDLLQTLAPTDVTITTNLGDLQNALLAIETNTSVQPDPNGDLLTKWLNDPLLNWGASIAAKLITILKTIDDSNYANIVSANYTFLENLRIQYDAPFHDATLSVLGPIDNLSQLSGNISYNSGTKQLSFTGSMTTNEQTTLLAAFTDQDWQDAITFLHANPNGSTALDALPLLTSYASSSGQLIFNNDTKTLRFTGYLSATLRDALKNFYNSPNPVRDALDSLFNEQQTDDSAGNIFFASDTDVNTELKSINYTHIADRFAFFLQAISPVYKKLQQQAAIQTRISSCFTVDKTIAAQLLISVSAIFSDFTATAFIQKTNALTSANYPAQYNRYISLATIAFVVAKLKIDAVALAWILVHAADVDITNLSTLPVAPVATPVSANDFTAFENLINLISLYRSDAPTATSTLFVVLQDVIDGVKTIDDLETELADLFDWDKAQLKALVEAPNYLNLVTTPPATSNLKDVRILVRLYKCFATMQLLSVAAVDCINWSKPSLSFDDATKIKQTLKSRYSDADWLGVTTPLQNKLREGKRDALVTFLLANPGTNTWVDANDLYSYFLIDVEMSACQPTSRIVQATNAVQQFVQRSFMSMETDIIVNANDPDQGNFDSKWKQWQWMSQYRVWEANRKVFLYPENWIEPELLPGQSSFFKDLQNDLLQNEMTENNVEDAFMTYLEKLDGVARLEVKGMWYEDDNQTLHVVARTYGGDPKIYYYRQYVENRRWTAWEKIDLDINSDHVIPVVFNQRLYIFWAVFTEKGRDAPDSQQVPDIKESNFPIRKPDKYLQIQMAFSEYKNGKWAPKKISNNDDTGFIEDYQWAQNSVDSSMWYQVAPDKSKYFFSPVDLPTPDFSNLAEYLRNKDIKGWFEAFIGDIENSLKQNGTLNLNCYFVDDNGYYEYKGTFDLDPCRGYPVVSYSNVPVRPRLFIRSGLSNMLDGESDDTSNNFLAFPAESSILNQTPGLFNNLLPLQAGFFDRWMYLMEIIFLGKYQYSSFEQRNPSISLGTFMPFFYQDKTYLREKTGRTYYVAPEISDNDEFELFYSDLEAWFMQLLDLLVAILEGDTAAEEEIRKAMPQIPQGKQVLMLYHFYNFYHPQVCFFMRQLFNKGIDGLMSRQTQLKGDIAYDNDPSKFSFDTTYAPQSDVYTGQPVTYPNAVVDNTPGYPREDVDFNIQAGYSLYNWELFYHAPLLIAEGLSENQQFDDADKWFKYIFNPTDSSAYPAPDKFWVTKPFFMNVVDISGKTKYDLERIENIMFGIADPSVAHPNDLDKSVEDWRENPFQPHYIAQYRTVAYQKTTVMKYLDHLIRWGDYLFTQHTMETVTNATQLYVLAAQILGPEPKIIPPAYEVPVNNYYQLEKKLDSFSNVLVEIENLLPMHTYKGFDYSNPDNPDLPSLQSLYFCIPFNDNILQYWTTIADRLFKIRHCLDINGVFSPLALFAPPIDPGMLVRAAAAGLDLGSVLGDLNAPLPLYRFSFLLQKATDLCNEVKSLGGALLSALEKKDAEHLALLRSSHEIKLLNAVLQLKQAQINEAQNQIDNLTKQKELITIRRDYYQNLLSNGLSTGENVALALNFASTVIDTGIAIGYALAGGLKLIPDFILGASGFGGSPHATVNTGGKSFGDSAEDTVRTLQSIAAALDKNASLMSTNASYERRSQEWLQQLTLASKELEQNAVQLLGAQIRLDIATTDKNNQQLQIDNAKEDDDFMHSKFTNEDLYSWMIGKISTTYFQSYNLAYDTAKKAEQCFRFELGLADSAYVQFGYWDSMKKGLQSGESLMYNLKQMEMAYYEMNKREYELTKHVSLAQLDATALLQLQETGQCFINLPEEIFDLDYPGHYFRRLKSVNLSIPCVAGPYTTIGCTLTLMNNSVRIDGTSVSDAKKYPRKAVNGIPADDPRFRDSGGTSQSIALSHGQSDSGLFELNFRDERYLPFEGTGAISTWHLQFPFANTKDKSGTKVNSLLQQFDYTTISDVIIQLKYTAREGGDALKVNASDNLLNNVNKMLVGLKDTGLSQLFSLKHEFPTEWYAFLNQPDPNTGDQTCSIVLDANRLPFFASQMNIKITGVALYADAINPTPQLHVTSPGNITNNNFSFAANPAFGTLLVANPTSQPWGNNTLGTWKIVKPGNTAFTSADIKDMYVLVKYSVG